MVYTYIYLYRYFTVYQSPNKIASRFVTKYLLSGLCKSSIETHVHCLKSRLM